MIQRKLFNLNLARTARMLSGASRVAVMLLLMLLITTTAWADEVNYIDENGEPKTANATVLTGTETSLDAGWYICNTAATENSGKGLSYTSTLQLYGDVHLILADNCKMTVETTSDNAISSISNIAIYGQSTGDNAGSLIANANNYGIYASGNITISGGQVTATGTNHSGICSGAGTAISIINSIINAKGAKYGIYGSCSEITISGGTVIATGTSDGGIYCGPGKISITDCNVTATGGSYGIYASGIITISGEKVEAIATGTNGNGINTGANKITITDGEVIAIGGSNGIKGGAEIIINKGKVTANGTSGSGIESGGASNISITDCEVNAKGGNNGIKGGTDVTINGGKVTANGTSGSGIESGSASNISITDCEVNAEGGNNGIKGGSNGVTISGGQVEANNTGSNGYGICSGIGGITLGWTNATDYICVNSYATNYNGPVKTVDGKRFVAYNMASEDDISASAIVSGSSNDSNPTFTLANIAGKTLIPLSGYYVTTEDGITVTDKDTPNYTIDTTPYYIYEENATVSLSCSRESYDCTFVMNGNPINGNTFQMPAEDVAVTAESWIVVSGYCGKVDSEAGLDGSQVTWKLTKSEGSDDYDVLTISGTGAMENYSASNDYLPGWTYKESNAIKSNIKYVNIEEGLTTIGSSAFRSCTNITEINTPASVTSIGNNAFSSCKGLTTVNFAEDSKLKAIGSNAFLLCGDLTTINLENCSQLETIGNSTFRSCAKIENITIPASVTSIGDHAFFNCNKLTNIYVFPVEAPDLGTDAFRLINNSYSFFVHGNAYVSADGWKSLSNKIIIGTVTLGTDINATVSSTPDNINSPVITYDSKAYYAEGTTFTLNYSSELPEDCTFGGYMVKDVNGDNVTVTENADSHTFQMPAMDVTVTCILNHYTTGVSYIATDGSNATTPEETKVYYLNGTETTLGTSNLDSWYIVPENGVSYPGTLNIVGNVHLILADGSAMTASSIDGNGQLTLYAQSGQTGKITANSYTSTVNIAQHFVADDGTTTSLILRGFADLDVISGKTLIPLNGYYVTTEDGITVTDKNTPDYTIGSIHYYIFEKDATVTLSQNREGYEGYDCTFVVNGNPIEGNTFQMPAEDVAVTAESWIVVSGYCGKVDSEAGLDGTQLKWRVSKSENSSNYDVLSISGTGEMANYLATNPPSWKNFRSDIKTVIIGNGVTTIGNYAFNNSNLSTIIFAEGSQLTTIGERSFNLCGNLTTVNLENCLQLETIGNSAFRSCAKIETITIPANVTSIGDYAFFSCTSLATFYVLPANAPTIGTWAFNKICDGYRFFVHGNTYVSADGWKSLSNKIVIGTVTLGTDINATVSSTPDNINSPVITYDTKAYYAEGTTFTLSNSRESYSCTYAVNGTDIEGNTFQMPAGDVTVLASWELPLFTAGATNTWMTWCDVNAWTLPEGCTAYTISSVSGTTVNLSEITAAGENAPVIIPAYTPVLIKRSIASADAVKATFIAEGTAPDSGYDSATGIASTTDTGFTFYGNVGDTKFTDNGETKYVHTIEEYDGTQSYVLRGCVFLKVDKDEGITAHRCWLNVSAGSSNAARLSIVIGDESTGITTTNYTNYTNSDDAWYSLDGRKLNDKPTKKGLYINSGRKVVIK